MRRCRWVECSDHFPLVARAPPISWAVSDGNLMLRQAMQWSQRQSFSFHRSLTQKPGQYSSVHKACELCTVPESDCVGRGNA
ncbi:hypothetical protein CLOP_g1091 [Closterium sp. NIES-67]|nr:hypothetical protein CLOP_g1091 [Closterium sp. NIES-67]